MKTKSIILILILAFFTSCIKETYDTRKISDKMAFSPGIVLSVAKGEINLKDIIKENDTLFFDDANLLKLLFRSDSIIEFAVDDLADLDDTFDYDGEYEIGELSIDSFGDTTTLTLNYLSTFFSAPLRTQFLSLDDGFPHPFPAFPSTGIGTMPLPLFSGFEWAIFAEGQIEVSVKNNLPTLIAGATITILNTIDDTPVGAPAVIGPIASGATTRQTISLAGVRATNSLKIGVVINGSPGNPSPVIIDLDHGLDIGVAATGLEVSSGRVIIPMQTRQIDDKDDTIVVDPGSGMELVLMKINSGSFSYTITSTAPVGGTLDLLLPSVDRGGSPMSETISVAPFSSATGIISMDNTLVDMSTVVLMPYNRLPVDYSITMSSLGSMVDFDSSDKISISLQMDDPDFDYIKGYLGNHLETLDNDSINLEIDEILDHISGQFRLIDPSIKVEYINSFGFPVSIDLDGVGKRGTSTVDLALSPFILDYPTSLTNREVTSSFIIGKSNSNLPEFISLPPSSIVFSGEAEVNPGGNTGSRDNYLFGNSSFVASLEFDLPMELWMKDLVFTDTLENFLDFGDDFSTEDIEYLNIEIESENMFPLEAGVEIILVDSITGVHLSTLTADKLISASVVDANGKSSDATESVTTIEIDDLFFEAAKSAGEIIIKFKMNTTGNGTVPVKIYSDYYLKFKVRVSLKAEIIVN